MGKNIGGKEKTIEKEEQVIRYLCTLDEIEKRNEETIYELIFKETGEVLSSNG